MFVAVLPEFIEPENCPLSTPDLNPVDYSSSAGSIATDSVSSKMLDIDWLGCVLIDCWT